MEHKKWEPGSLYAQAMRDITNEHNATVDALKEAQTRYMDVIAENNRLDRELDGARQALKQPLRVPFSGEQIEKMAKAMHNAGMEYMRNLNPCGPTYRSWDEESEVAKDGRKLMVRAAVAAGGLEPCPVPEYRPEEVALTPSADEVEKLARVLDNAETEYLQHNQSREVCFNVMACAAIAHLRPTQGNVLRDRLVEARLKVENQRVELARLNKQREGDSRLIAKLHAQLDALHPGETIEGVVMERDHYRIQLEREQEWTKQYKADRDDALAELVALRERAEQAEAERDDLQCESSIIGELRAVLGLGWGESITERCKELAALRQRESVPVKVRFSCTLEEVVEVIQKPNTKVRAAELAMDYLASHAVIDVPAGVPSVEELARIAYELRCSPGATYADKSHEEEWIRIATAIRDTVLAGIAAVRTSTEPTDAQVEALARVLRKAHAKHYNIEPEAVWLEGFRSEARAAFAHIGAVPGVDPDAWTENFKAQSCAPNSEDCFLEINPREKFCEFIIRHGDKCMYLSTNPADAARASIWLASYAAAHGYQVALPAPERTKGLPAAEELAEMHYEHRRKGNKSWSVMSWVEHREDHPDRHKEYIEATEHILAALAPFLREPVGWELDAPEGGWLSEGFCIHNPSTGETHSLDSFVSHVCSRIRPVYECKECAAWKTKYNESNQEINKALEAFGIAMPALSAARAALEGE